MYGSRLSRVSLVRLGNQPVRDEVSCPPLIEIEQRLAPDTPVTTFRRDHLERSIHAWNHA